MMAAPKTTHDERERPAKTGPQRTCAGCAKSVPADELVRVVVDEGTADRADRSGETSAASMASGEGGAKLAVDLADSKFGRGAHVHPSPDCLAKALKTGFSRAFKTKIASTMEEVGGQIVASADRRIEGLLAGAKRARLVVSGSDTVREALREGTARLVVVARDAAAAVKVTEIEQAITEGTAMAWGNKQSLGALFGRDEVAVCAVLHEGVAAAMASAYRTSRPFADGSRSEAWWCPEVR